MENSDPTKVGRTHCPAPSIDKWAALSALTDAADEYGLTHRSLGVLKALMTFLPGRDITPGTSTVFPSNKTLSHRLNGMPESTLRRHLAQLVKLGIVSRHDSPNRKRYARVSGQAALVFGFDLSPLAHHWEQLQNAATCARRHSDEVALLRARAAQLRKQLLDRNGTCTTTEEARVLLRRKLNLAALQGLVSRLEDAWTTQELSAPDSQNERHIQYDFNIPTKPDQKSAAPELTTVLTQCKEYQSYFPQPVRSWHDLIAIADRMAGMIGITARTLEEAISSMGVKHASIAVLCILERLGKIANPGGYLRRLAQSARAGQFDIAHLLSAVRPMPA